MALKESEIADCDIGLCGQLLNTKWPLQPIFERVRRVTNENVWPVAHSARASEADATAACLGGRQRGMKWK